MTRTLTAISDRLLGALVPRVTAQAEPCGPLDDKLCYCAGSYAYYKKCCRYSGSCYPCRRLSRPGCPV